MTDFKIRRGLSTDLFINGDNKAGIIDGVVLENGCWYLCTDTADLFLCVQQTNGLTLKRINEKAGWDITIDGDTIDASVIIALRAEVDNVKESLNDYATKQYVVDAIDKHEALAAIEEVKAKLEEEVLPTVQETILPTVQKVETEILPTVQELVEKTATQEWVNTQLNIIENNIGYVATNDKSFAEVIDETFAKKSEVPSINGLATETFVHEMIAKAELEDKEADLEAYYTKSEVDALIPEVPTKVSELENDAGYITSADIPETDLSNYYDKTETENLVNEAISKIEHPTVSLDGYATESWVGEQGFIKTIPEEYITAEELAAEGFIKEHQSLDEYAKLTDIPDVSKFIKEIPSEYITEEELNTKGFITEHQDLSGKADVDHRHDNYAEKDHAHEAYYTKSEVDAKIPSLDGYAKTEDIPTDYLTETDLDGYAKSADLSDMATKTWVSDQGFITNVDNKADVTHTHDEYLTSSALDGYSKFSGSYKDLTDKPEIPSLEGYALKSEVEVKADNVLFTTDKYVTTAFGGFIKGESVKDLTIAQLLTKLLGLADEAPSVEPDVPSEPGNVTVEEVKRYSIPVMQGAVKNGEVTTENTASAFNYLELTEAEAEKAPQEAEPGTALLYEIKDNSGNVIEAGYQIYTIASGRGTKYRVALAEGLTITKVEMFDDGTKSWVPYELTFTETGDRLTHDGYSYVLYESSSSSNCEILRFIIE